MPEGTWGAEPSRGAHVAAHGGCVCPPWGSSMSRITAVEQLGTRPPNSASPEVRLLSLEGAAVECGMD